MNAHQLDADGVIINTIVVDSLDVFPNLVDASIGGRRGDCVVDGMLIPRTLTADEINAPALSAITALESTVTPRRIREAVTTDAGKTWMASIDAQIAALRGSLVK